MRPTPPEERNATTAPPAALKPTADDLIVQTAKRDGELGVQRALQTIRERHSRPVAAALTALVHTTINTLHVIDRMEAEVRFIISYAHRLNAGEDVRALVHEALPELLRRKRVNLLVRDKDPAYKPLEHAHYAAFERRLPDLARMVAVEDPVDYDDMVRRAFPERPYVDHIIDDNAAFVHGIIDHLESHPQLLRVPQSLVGKLSDAARDIVDWQIQKVRAGLDEIYANTPAPADANN